MDEEEEERVLFNDLGVTSANPEDIERDILAEAKDKAGEWSEAGRSTEEQLLDDEKVNDPSSSSRTKIFSKLRAVEFEIDAVTASVEQASSGLGNENCVSDRIDNREEKDVEDDKYDIQVNTTSSTLQHALATDRLRSLRKTKLQLQTELSDLDKDKNELIGGPVKEEVKQKKRPEEVQTSKKYKKKRQKTVSFDEDGDFDAVLDAASAGFVETERDELVRKGILTPFHKLKGFERRLEQPGTSVSTVPEEEDKLGDIASNTVARAVRSITEAAQARPTTKLVNANDLPKLDAPTHTFRRLKPPLKIPQSPDTESEKKKGMRRKHKRPLPDKKWRKAASHEVEVSEESDESRENLITSDFEEENLDINDADDSEPSYVTLEGGLKIPQVIFSKLFEYQKIGVQWLWELHCQKAGGIIGDEMGLGKTIQVLSFLGALHFSNMYKPSIIICPVTLLRQWKREAQKWYPNFRVEILHDSAQIPASRKKRAESDESDYETEGSLDSDHERASTKTTNKWDSLIGHVLRSKSGLLITTYEQLRLLSEKLLDIEWGYAVLDEGHRIRNPNAEVTLVCKQLQTVHRVIMTGAPIQNKLTELWSLFDFVFPGKLGVLPVFEAEFAVPISVGGYANATPLQVSTAYRCAVVLRDLIMPYLLRRMKADVNAHLPKKTEHVLFCSLTAEQRSIYRAFLASSEVEQIFDGNRNSLYGIDVMRKICNHPDLLEREHSSSHPDYGNPERSGKMKVVAQVLKVWKDQGHRVLLFAQTQQMLDILESFLITGDYTYRRMDGQTPVKQRMALIDEFNNSNDICVFILTTKVGGLGTNLTGANRVIIFDPDWNPSTDMQARERAWRIGQTKDVTVYRLITRGTIEEKVYHRQIYKHFLTNKILKNPQQRRFFKARDMKDLFTLQDDAEGGSTETSNIFGQLSGDINVIEARKEKRDKQRTSISAGKGSVDTELDRGTRSSACKPSRSKGKEKEKADQKIGEMDQETNVLQSLFDAHGIHSAMNHDEIMNAQDEEEKMRLEGQASQVAQRAAEALRQSRILRSQDSISVPTWTGKSGAAGAPSSVRRKFGSTVNSHLVKIPKPSEGSSGGMTKMPNGITAGASAGKALTSAELLSRIRGTQEIAVEAGLEHQFDLASSSSSRGQPSTMNRHSKPSYSMQPEVLIRHICTFIQQHGGSTTSTRIVEHFKERVPSEGLPLFKNLLKEIATRESSPTGCLWVLKPEFHQQ
ncbi:Chromatin remodeling [Thalictrum thalictroides]|uniref:Chromatin remodeling n=1 Tax=Thalictrum thalictroides TaxID=46969 RepID=A0A7J6W6R8_THATH|nr:Chromatin remodeling [Thalictrum thalictroides]